MAFFTPEARNYLARSQTDPVIGPKLRSGIIHFFINFEAGVDYVKSLTSEGARADVWRQEKFAEILSAFPQETDEVKRIGLWLNSKCMKTPSEPFSPSVVKVFLKILMGRVLEYPAMLEKKAGRASSPKSPADEIQVGIGSSAGCIYVGPFEEDKRHGRGYYFHPNGDVYAGQYRQGKREGLGEFHFANGNRYLGEFKDNFLHGKGEMRFANGETYKGDFNLGEMTGEGILFLSDGARYEGQVLKGKFHGTGTLLLADKSAYEGEFQDGMYHGKGKLSLVDGSSYVGGFAKDQPHGYGTLRYPDGRADKGAFIEGVYQA